MALQMRQSVGRMVRHSPAAVCGVHSLPGQRERLNVMSVLQTGRSSFFRPAMAVPAPSRRMAKRLLPPMMSADPGTEPSSASEFEESDSETARKKAEADRLRAAEKFMVIGSGTAACKGCGYEYSPDKGDPDFPVPKGVRFQDLPEDYTCPICGAEKARFESRVKVVAGFAENQQYGLGTNSMTESQKSLLIYGALAAFFLLFLAGYALD